MGKGRGTETYTRFDLAEQWQGRAAVHKIGPSGSPNHRGSAFAVRYQDNPAAGRAAMGAHLAASLAEYHFDEPPDYHGYHLEIELAALATAVAAGHDEIVSLVHRLLAARVAYEGLLEDVDGRLCAPGTRRGGPWDDSADEARSWLEHGRSAGHSKKLAGAIERQTDWMGAAMARDAVLRGLVDRIPRNRASLPERLRSPLIIRRYEHGFLAWHPELACYGGPWWLVAVDNRRPRDARLVASLSWKDVTPHWKQRTDGVRGYDMGGGPWTRAGLPFPEVDLGALVEEVTVGGAADAPLPPGPKPPPVKNPPEPPEPEPPKPPKPEPPGDPAGRDFIIPDAGLRLMVPQGERKAEILLRRIGRWRFVEWHDK